MILGMFTIKIVKEMSARGEREGRRNTASNVTQDLMNTHCRTVPPHRFELVPVF